MTEPGMEVEARELHRVLQEREATLATAESLTGGQLAMRITAVPGSSASFVGGVVAYATELKQRLLEVPDEVVEGPGVVSAECAAAMAEGVRRLCGATYALATTGVAGPAEQEGKPVGTVYVGAAGPDGTETELLELEGGREQIQEAACRGAMGLLLAMVRREETPVG